MSRYSKNQRARKWLEGLLAHADIRLDGDRPFDIRVHDERLFDRVTAAGTLGAGEAYMEGWWDCEALDRMFARAISAGLENKVSRNLTTLALALRHTLFNMQSRRRAPMVARRHYDFGNELFEAMLGPNMNYSCAWWSGLGDVKKRKAGDRSAREGSAAPDPSASPDSLPACYPQQPGTRLEEAQNAKMELICQKLQLAPGMTVLDIGCGWGSLARYMARQYGCHVTGISISRNQIEWARRRELEPGGPVAPGRITWILGDYRELRGEFDRIVSVGMFEHVGRKNYRRFFRTARGLLKPRGLFLLHTIGSISQRAGCDPWISRYIFPNGQLPTLDSIVRACQGLFVLEDCHNLGADYDPTLMAWRERFDEGLRAGAFDLTDAEARMFRYYLLTCAAAFRCRDIELWQIMLSPGGVAGGYEAVR
ncbi:cyclopropane-fatty-acyl-phospholipid synthase [Desulfovibrio sp.]|uniref:cyclopropane-fatty-acyl-phospholipid synthase n=1 Tax=Desulfovibrio sp. TaxID=885 RepID=UPI0023D06818|nr:cyclopropane-fatty-acyl-phospholipid synthase [Desulfovibrio sp.]MDE7241944.1 cyclopropane-fatty-acyl-phospholipid synthase [Desulfovibrio sp.]